MSGVGKTGGVGGSSGRGNMYGMLKHCGMHTLPMRSILSTCLLSTQVPSFKSNIDINQPAHSTGTQCVWLLSGTVICVGSCARGKIWELLITRHVLTLSSGPSEQKTNTFNFHNLPCLFQETHSAFIKH